MVLMLWSCLLLSYFLSGAASIHVELRAPKYVTLGNSALLKCDYNVPHDQLHKVEWLRGGKKIWQYVKGRKPPYRSFPVNGIHVDESHSNENQVLLTNMNFEASGAYTCEVSTEKPIIYTKPSEEHDIIVMQNQAENPRITFRKPTYMVGDWLEVNCTSGTARPTPDVTWLLNGKKAEPSRVKSFPGQCGEDKHCCAPSSVTAQLRFQVTEDYIDKLELTCLATIPRFLGHSIHHTDYADHRMQNVSVDVLPLAARYRSRNAYNTSSSHPTSITTLLIFLLLCWQH